MGHQKLKRNILVISDLHLGEDVRPNATAVSYLRRIARLERELESFLLHYTEHRVDGRPWRLVINGDMVDFMSVLILPVRPVVAAESPAQHQADPSPSLGGLGAIHPAAANCRMPMPTDDEVQFGLACAERQTVEKLDRVMDRHSSVFARLAAFVAADNELVIVVGNHDVEFHFPEVQQRFVERLAEHAPSLAVVASIVREAGEAERIRFCPWFYYEEELVYVEHGHQYDEYCSFDYQLHPVESHDGSVALSIAHGGMRYFTNLVPTIDPHVGEQWGFFDYLGWAAGHGARRMVQIFFLYGVFVWKMIELCSRLTEVKSDAVRGQRHRARLKALADDYRIAAEKIEALDQLRSSPVVRSFVKILRALFIDRIALGLSVVVALAVALWVESGWWKAAAAAMVLVAAAGLNFVLSRGRMIPSEVALRRVPEAIRRILRAPFIVFGHSHFAEAVSLESGGMYFNTGAWAHPDLQAAFTHLIISGDVPHAELRQWRDGASAPLKRA